MKCPPLYPETVNLQKLNFPPFSLQVSPTNIGASDISRDILRSAFPCKQNASMKHSGGEHRGGRTGSKGCSLPFVLRATLSPLVLLLASTSSTTFSPSRCLLCLRWSSLFHLPLPLRRSQLYARSSTNSFSPPSSRPILFLIIYF